ncbi:hypothetical protein BHM03_00046194 [Ensete ventricosum]|nr:hypothetical protein BHM03_00046194 [Ensete ventricosum]
MVATSPRPWTTRSPAWSTRHSGADLTQTWWTQQLYGRLDISKVNPPQLQSQVRTTFNTHYKSSCTSMEPRDHKILKETPNLIIGGATSGTPPDSAFLQESVTEPKAFIPDPRGGEMPVLTCNACNKGFDDEAQQKLHYRSEWHRYNLKRKVMD